MMAQDDPIQRNFVVLSSYLDMNIVPYLRNQDMLTTDEYTQLTCAHVSEQLKKEQLLILMPRKGRRFFEKFSKCLVWSGQTWLAEQIGINVAAIPPSPYPAPPPPAQPSPDEMYAMIMKVMAGSQSLPGHHRSVSTSIPPVPSHPHQTFDEGPNSLPPSPQFPQAHPPSYASRPPQPSPPLLSPQPPQPSPPLLPSRPPQPSPPLLPSRPPQPSPSSQPSSPQNLIPPAPTLPEPRVLVMYYKETQEYCEGVKNMVEMLTYIGGAKYILDLHLTGAHPPNWTEWIEKEIDNSNFVVLVCSQKLQGALQGPTPDGCHVIEMDVARFFSNGVYTKLYRNSAKFIPVYLNQHRPQDLRDWVPNPLGLIREYHLDIEGLAEEVGEIDDESEIAEKIGSALELSQFKGIRHLVAKIRGQAVSEPPNPAYSSVPLQSAGIPSAHQGRPNSSMSPPLPPPQAATPNHHPKQSRVSEDIPEHVLLEIVDRIDNWQRLGIVLGVQYTYLEKLRRKYPNDVTTPALEMFRKWREMKGTNATKHSLQKALENCGYIRLASELSCVHT